MLKLQQIQAAGLLARGYSNVETARRCGIGRGTLYRWKASPEFRQNRLRAAAKLWPAFTPT